ncbi:hypothetical protein IEQ34_015421 [Dendrobium chrysotoxum]|uniref:Uncharacterized protein n=1 Tax=Dendrobium chrysotoxum TaxID=161865 RepID=A0AAV7GIE8_DENCH|nr:hypothetical protein IEQ34_015421 [Dendrobium chrysotoxum]
MEPLSNIPSIQKLTIKGNDELVSFSVETEQWFLQHAFPLLEKLHITKLKALKDWSEEGVAAKDGCLFCLIELVLNYYPKLKELLSLPSKLKTLEIQRLGG